jgi:hypothetical protein
VEKRSWVASAGSVGVSAVGEITMQCTMRRFVFLLGFAILFCAALSRASADSDTKSEDAINYAEKVISIDRSI